MKIELFNIVRGQSGGIIARVKISEGEHSEKRSFRLTDEDFRRFGLKEAPGELTQEQFTALEEASEYCGAVEKAAELLAYGANSRMTLELKLRRRGYSDAVAARATQYILERGLVDEQSDADAVVRSCLSKGYGRRRISMKLREKGYDAGLVSEALGRIDDFDFAGLCVKVIRKKYREIPTDRHEVEKLVAAMSRYGYSLSEIRDAIRRIESED